MSGVIVVAGLDIRKFAKELEDLGKRAPFVMARALNRAGIAGKTAMVKAVRQDTGITEKAINREIQLDKARPQTPRVTFQIKGARIPLIAFSARGPEPSRGRGRGVSYRLPTGRGRIGNAFIATMPTGHRGVFKRVAGAVKRRGPKPDRSQLPIQELYGPSLPHVFQKYTGVFEQAAQASLEKNLRSEIDFANRPKGDKPDESAA